jgi:hypothetical protein
MHMRIHLLDGSLITILHVMQDVVCMLKIVLSIMHIRRSPNIIKDLMCG